jgi:hypothetical protein
MDFYQWREHETEKRIGSINQFLSQVGRKSPEELAKLPWETLDAEKLATVIHRDEVTSVRAMARMLANDLVRRPNEKAPRLKRGKGQKVRAERWRAVCAITCI